MEIIRGMYRLPQTGILSNNLLAQHFHNHGYYQVKRRTILWRHVWIPISLTLVVDDFGMGYVGQEHADQLTSALKMYYENNTTDWEGRLYCGITMKWNDKNGM